MDKFKKDSRWENIKGFDINTGEFIRLDGEKWLKDHRIKEEAKRRGKHNFPDSEESQPDEMSEKIVLWIQKRATDCKNIVHDYINQELTTLHSLSGAWRNNNPAINLDKLIKQSCQDIEMKARQELSDLESQRSEYNDAKHDLDNFRKQNNLLRVAHYPNSQTAHWLWVVFAAIIESFVSANLLGSVSRGGVIEGWMLAVVLTLINVSLGIGAGKFLRLMNFGWGVKFFASVTTILFSLIALVWNALAGHLRDVYVLAEKNGEFEAIDKAFRLAYQKVLDQPLPWESLSSAGLALIGIVVFVLAVYKSYCSDDPFPRYGMKDRKVESLRVRYQENLNNARNSIKSMGDEMIMKIEEINERYQADLFSWNTTTDRLNSVKNEYHTNLHMYNSDLKHFLAVYRTVNIEARTSPTPSFFQQEHVIGTELLNPPEFKIPSQPRWGDIPMKSRKGSERILQTCDEQLSQFQMLDEVNEHNAGLVT